MSDSLWTHGLHPCRLLCPWNFPDKNTQEGWHFFFFFFLLQEIFPNRGWTYLLYRALAGRFFTTVPPGKPLVWDKCPGSLRAFDSGVIQVDKIHLFPTNQGPLGTKKLGDFSIIMRDNSDYIFIEYLLEYKSENSIFFNSDKYFQDLCIRC